MKKKGSTFIEIIVAITIFLIAILPIAYLTLNSLRVMKRASEIEEGARVATSVINYIKSQGYDSIMESGGLLSSYDKNNPIQVKEEKSYLLRLSSDRSTYVLDIPSNNNGDFEKDFLGKDKTETRSGEMTPEDSLFLINSLGISSETITITVNLATSDLKVANTDFSPDTSYINPVSYTSGSGIIIGSDGIIKDPIIYGNVFIEYETLSNTLNEKKYYNQNFILTPLENFK